MADQNPEENQNDEPVEISTGREDVEKKPEEEQRQEQVGNFGGNGSEKPEGEEMPGGQEKGDKGQGEGEDGEDGEGEDGEEKEGEGEGEEKSDEPGDKEGEEGEGEEGEEKGEEGEPKPSDEGEEEEGEGEEESEEEKEEREKKEKEKQEKRDQEDKEEKEKRDKEDSEKAPDKKKKEKRDKEDQKKKEKRDKEDQKEKQDRRDKKDKRDKEKREQEDKEEQEKRDKQDEKDEQEKDPKKREQKKKDRKEKRDDEDFKKKKKREKEDRKKQEKRDKEDEGDSIVGKRVMIVYGNIEHLGDVFLVKKLLRTIILEDADDLREIKAGEKLELYQLESLDENALSELLRTDFVVIDGGDSILWQEGGNKYTNEVKKINIPEKELGVETAGGVYSVVVDKVLKAIPSGKSDKERKEEKEKEEKQKDDGLFHSLSVVLVKDVVEIFKAKGLFPGTEDTFLVCHFPRRIYSIYNKILLQDGLNNAELIERTGSGLEDYRGLDRYLAKMILKQFQTAAYYYDPEYAFDNILYDNLAVLNVFNSKNVLVKRPNSADIVSVFRNENTLTVNSVISGNTFLEDIIFGERKNIVKFGLWKNHKYEKIQELYNFLEFVVSTSRLVSDEDKNVLEYDDINNEIAKIYNNQLKALENAV